MNRSVKRTASHRRIFEMSGMLHLMCLFWCVLNGHVHQLYTFFLQGGDQILLISLLSGVPRKFVRGGGGSTNSVEDRGQRKRGSGGGSPLVRGCRGSCNLVQEISFHIVKFP